MKSLYEDRKYRINEYIQSKDYHPMKIKQMALMLNVPSDEREDFRDIIKELIAEDKIYIDKRGKIKPQEDTIVVGRFSQAKQGFGFVVPEDGGEDIFVNEACIDTAMHGDLVSVKLNRGAVKNGKKREGVIVNILERAVSCIVGTLDMCQNYAFVIPDSTRQIRDLFIPKEKIGGAKHGEKVVALITDYGDGRNKNPEGRVVEVLGNPTDPGVDILSIAKAFGIPEEFPEKVLKEAKMMPETVEDTEHKDRKDIRDWLTITIDGEDAKDLDDAVTLTYENGVYTLGVHIADVTNYVKEGKPLDKEAIGRGTSVYLVDRVIPMLPRELSNGICSLNQGVDRLALSCIMQLDEQGNVIGHEIAETIINVNHRMTYTSVNKIVNLMDEEERSKYKDVVPMLENMRKLAELRIAIRIKQGSIDFDFPESKIILDEKGWPIEIKPYDRNIATRIIEEFMLLANQTVAEDYYWQEQPFLYRSHENPDPGKMQELSIFVSNYGMRIKKSGESIHPKEIQKLLAGIKGRPEENMISRLALRSMKRARYTSTADGHFGLAMKYYCHFTSPIRRYPDLQIHRIIKDNIHGRLGTKRKEHYYSIIDSIAESSSRLERRAEEAEREVHKLKKAQYMSDRIGEQFDGVISGVTGWGIYVELPDTIEGMVRIEDITDDSYYFDEMNYKLIGRRKKKEYTLGQQVTVKVLRTDLDTRTIDFLLVADNVKKDDAD